MMKIDYKSNKFKIGMAIFISFLVFLIFLVVFFKRYKEKYKDKYTLEEPDLENYSGDNIEKEGYQKQFNKSVLTNVFYQKQIDSTRLADSLKRAGFMLDSAKNSKVSKSIKKSKSISTNKKVVKDTTSYSLQVPETDKKTPKYSNKKKTTTYTNTNLYNPDVQFYFKTTDKYQNYANVSSSDTKNSSMSTTAKKFEAVIYGDQEISNGGTVAFKSVNDLYFGKTLLAKHTIFFGRAKYVGNRINVNVFQAVSQTGNFEVSMNVFDNDYQEGIFHNFGFVEEQEKSVGGVVLDEATNLIPGTIGTVVNSSTNISKNLLKAHEKSVYLKDGYSVFIKFSK